LKSPQIMLDFLHDSSIINPEPPDASPCKKLELGHTIVHRADEHLVIADLLFQDIQTLIVHRLLVRQARRKVLMLYPQDVVNMPKLLRQQVSRLILNGCFLPLCRSDRSGLVPPARLPSYTRGLPLIRRRMYPSNLTRCGSTLPTEPSSAPAYAAISSSPIGSPPHLLSTRRSIVSSPTISRSCPPRYSTKTRSRSASSALFKCSI